MNRSASAALSVSFGLLLSGARLAGAQALFGSPSAIQFSATSAAEFTPSLMLTPGATLNTTGGIDLVPSAAFTSINFTVSRSFSLAPAGVYACSGAFDGLFWSSTKYTSQSVDNVLVRTSILDASGALVARVDSYPSFMGFATLPPIAGIPYLPAPSAPASSAAHVTAGTASSPSIMLTITDPLQPYTLEQDVTVDLTTFGLQPGALPTHLSLTSTSNLIQPRAGVPEPSAFAFAVIGTACITACASRAHRRSRRFSRQ